MFSKEMSVTAKFQLVVQQGPRRGEVFLLENSIITIGRDPLLEVALADPEVSRQHARMARDENGDYKIQDLGSTNGTFVNGQRLGGEPYLLSAGQQIVLGSSVILLYESATAEEGLPAMSASPEWETAVSSEPDLSIESAFETPEEFAPFAEPPEPASLTDSGDLQQEEPPPPQRDQLFSPTSAAAIDPTWTTAEPLRSPSGSASTPFVPAGASEKEQKRKKTITWILVTVLLLMLCCCGFLLSAWYWWGDPLMEALGVY